MKRETNQEKGMERIGGGKRKREEEKEGGENSPLVKDRQGKYWYRFCGTIKVARAGTGTSQDPWWAD
ncbi:hypothetical protein N7508_006824 [Penicillium antarcticum]|uniref:uncharacterized protein n=1 Tax=Penicillium antarcticum TaxID=416450 RepID=UPI002390EBC4|nr:uncharacterized protein N7508_006824 [Penicillium antarcticum]KAJ5301961.1 hypothetical protein N7508_006824 [Penicillium antarcticum]